MKTAFLFPGQGSQAKGMGKFVWENYPRTKELWSQWSREVGFDLAALCLEMSDEELALTANTQPAIVAVSIILDLMLKERGFTPQAVAGHSVGEYAALVSAGVLEPAQALLAVRKRGQWMQEACPPGVGGMSALLGLNEEQARALCDEVNRRYAGQGRIWCANFNTQGQIVLSGHKNVLDALQSLSPDPFPAPINQWKWKIIPLQVSAPFHCPLMEPAQKAMAQWIQQMPFKPSHIPVIQNADAKPHTQVEELKSFLAQQISAPVLWLQSLGTLRELGVERVIEVGYGRVVSGLVKKSGIDFQLDHAESLLK